MDDIFNFAKLSSGIFGEYEQTLIREATNPHDVLHILLKLAGTDTWRHLEGGFIEYSM